VVSIFTSFGVWAMTRVTGPMGSAWAADSLREESIFHVPEKSGLPWADREVRETSEATITAQSHVLINPPG
jgi:hypothetical protein